MANVLLNSVEIPCEKPSHVAFLVDQTGSMMEGFGKFRQCQENLEQAAVLKSNGNWVSLHNSHYRPGDTHLSP